MEGYEIERERKRVWLKKKPPSEVVVVMSQPCRFGLVSGAHFSSILWLSYFQFSFNFICESFGIFDFE